MIIEIIDSELNAIGANRSTLAGLTGITTGRISSLLNGLAKPSFEEEKDINRCLVGLKKLVETVSPFLLDFRKTVQLKEQIELLESKRLHVSVFVEDTPAEKPKGYWVRLHSGRFFSRQDRDGVPLFQLNILTGLPVFSQRAADDLIAELAKIGHTGAYAQENKNFDGGGLIDDLDLVWNAVRKS